MKLYSDQNFEIRKVYHTLRIDSIHSIYVICFGIDARSVKAAFALVISYHTNAKLD